MCCEEAPAAWMWAMLIERHGKRSTNIWPSLWDEEKGAIEEAEFQFECKVIKVKGKVPLFFKGDVDANEGRDTEVS
jgi:hypothetical protein